MGLPDRGFEFFEHTADVGLRVSGSTLAALFAHAAQGLVTLIAEDSTITRTDSRQVALSAGSVADLLRTWLTELIFWFDAQRFLPSAYDFQEVTETRLCGQVQGERFDPTRHTAGVEVKGVTRHQFAVEHRDALWTARIIFDV